MSRTSLSLLALSQDLQKESCGVSDSPPPMLPSLIECDHIKLDESRNPL